MSQWISNRRDLIKSSITGALGLCFGFSLPWNSDNRSARAQGTDQAELLHAFIRIFSDNQVEIVVVKAEMGQGVATSLAMIICEELDADWSQVTVRLEGELPTHYDPQTGGLAATFGSTSVRSQYQRLRVIGAAVKANLIRAAATRLVVAADQLNAGHGIIYDQLGEAKFTYGELAREAGGFSLPENPPLKDPKQFKLIGTRTRRKDTDEKIEGKAIFGIDVILPDLHYAAVKHHPSFGSKLKNLTALRQQIPAGYQLVEGSQAIMIVGASYWQAQQILDKLPTEYEITDDISNLNQAALEKQLADAVQTIGGVQVQDKGDIESALQESSAFVEAEYFVPFLAHGAMEPMTCTAIVQQDRCEFWIPTQSAQLSALTIARVLNRPLDQIKINVTYLGGSFGRKVETDFVAEAALAALASGKPTQLIWSRSEDTQHDFYRPAFHAKLKAGLQDSRLNYWLGKNAGPSIMRRSNPATKVDFTSLEGFADIPYGIAHQRMFHEEVDLGIPIGYWRSVGKSQNTFFVESFIDEIAHRLSRDPLELRIELLEDQPRAQNLLNKLAEMCHWHDSPASLGLAFMEGFGSLAAIASKVRLDGQKVRVEKMWCAIDCGQVVNFDGAEAQIQGGAIFGLAAALSGKISINQGKVEQRIFGDMPYLNLKDCPEITVSFTESGAAMGGLGEVATPLAAPSVCNAIFRQTGQRIRRLPINDFRFI